MKLLGILPVLSTLLPLGQVLSAVAEPIPAEVRVHSLRSLHDGAEVVGSIAKRALTDDLFGDDGSGARYWAWSKLAYDGEYNSQPGKTLGNAQGKSWAKLGGSEIFVKGFAGPSVPGFLEWPTFTGMRAIVGRDSTNKVIVMAFIGSNDRPTFKQDLKFAQVTDSSSAIAGKVEKGFFECYDAVYQTAFEWTKQYADENPDWDIVITGHSLGGATAHVAAVGFAAAHSDLAGRTTVFTYGAPRAGDLEFQRTLATNQGVRMANFRHVHDVVPYVPPIKALEWTYANPGKRWIFEPSGDGANWFDQAQWTSVSDPDEETHRLTAIVAVAKDMMDKFAEHTAYFSSGGNARRSIRPVDDFKTEASSIQKRDPPSEQDLQYAEGLIGQMKQSNELKGEPTLTSNLEEFTKNMKITGEQGELVEGLNAYETEDDRVELLKFIELVAMEQ